MDTPCPSPVEKRFLLVHADHRRSRRQCRGLSAGSNAYNQHKHMRTGGDYTHTGYSRPAPFHPPAAPVWGVHGYVGLAPPPSDPYGGSHVPPVPVPLPPPVPAPSSYVSVKVVSCSKRTQVTVIETPNKKFVPKICSGSDTAIRPRRCNEGKHILVDDLSAHLGSINSCPMPSAFYAVFDGHGGSDAADYLNNNVMRILFEDADFPLTSDIDGAFLKKVEESYRKAFLLADRELADDCSASTVCGTTALTALVLGRHLLVANGRNCCAVLCRNGDAVQISQDHRPTYLPERRRVEEFGGIIEFGCLNGELAVTRALGDWNMKRSSGSASPLIAEPDVHQILLSRMTSF